MSDEIHYINDVERGSVWEETLMHLPPDVQMVALSATLKDPEKFVSWISSTRQRPGELVRRTDRHVPLHVGGLSPITNEFVEFYGTHGPRAQLFNSEVYTKLFSETCNAEEQAQKANAAANYRGQRSNELAAIAAANRGTAQSQGKKANGKGGKGSGGSKGGGKGNGKGNGNGKGGGGGGNGGGGKGEINFGFECTRLARQLKNLDQLPAVVFCMSQKKCVEGAHAIRNMNLLLGPAPKRAPNRDLHPEAYAAWAAQEQERQQAARSAEASRLAMHHRHLQR